MIIINITITIIVITIIIIICSARASRLERSERLATGGRLVVIIPLLSSPFWCDPANDYHDNNNNNNNDNDDNDNDNDYDYDYDHDYDNNNDDIRKLSVSIIYRFQCI